MTPVHKDIPDYRRMTYPEMRALVKWGIERGLLSVRPSLEDVRPQPKPKRRVEIKR